MPVKVGFRSSTQPTYFRIFTLDQAVLRKQRGDRNRLGFALQLRGHRHRIPCSSPD
ncbi:hypothetical protein [Scytonema sp. NUACC26]|uniref:hypothetical protein n=1 Tax=Scytonema sp. NUACC26 TaxID=3140176 RepID=UPI0034DBCDDA